MADQLINVRLFQLSFNLNNSPIAFIAKLLYKNEPSVLFSVLTKHLLSSAAWKINRTVRTAIADGARGFFIEGEFTKVGDSVRNYIAQIDRYGNATP